MAGLPGNRAMVWVGPPLFWSPLGSSPGLATPTWLPLTPLTRPPEPPVPIRLDALDGDTVTPLRRATSSAVVPPRVLSATIVLYKVVVLPVPLLPPSSPPPAPLPVLLLAMVELVTFSVPLLKMPPPSPAEL